MHGDFQLRRDLTLSSFKTLLENETALPDVPYIRASDQQATVSFSRGFKSSCSGWACNVSPLQVHSEHEQIGAERQQEGLQQKAGCEVEADTQRYGDWQGRQGLLRHCQKQ